MGECLIIRTGGGIDTSNATALANTILSGYTAYVNDEMVTGSLTNRGSVTSSLNPGDTYDIEEGYHDGSGNISASSLSDNTSGNATASQILNSYTGWVNGSKIIGSMSNQGTKTWTLTPNTSGASSQTIGGGYHNGSGKVSQSLTTVAGSTTTPGTANKTLAAASRWVTGNLIVAGNSNLIAGNIKNGVTIFGVKGTFTGLISGSGNMYAIRNGVLNTALKTKFEYWYSGDGSSLFTTNWSISDNRLLFQIGHKGSSATTNKKKAYIWFYTGKTVLNDQYRIYMAWRIDSQTNWSSRSSIYAWAETPIYEYGNGNYSQYKMSQILYVISGGNDTTYYTDDADPSGTKTTTTTGWSRVEFYCQKSGTSNYSVMMSIKDLYIIT